MMLIPQIDMVEIFKHILPIKKNYNSRILNILLKEKKSKLSS